MKLTKTQALIDRGLLAERFTSIAISVSKGDDCSILTSPNTDRDTYFDIASMGKVLITASLILRAVSDDLLSLDDTLERFWSVPEDKRGITIKQLLTHTSGIVRIPLSPKVAAEGNDSLAAQIIANPLAYKPGSDYIYSCNAYILLGFIAEKLYGAPLDVLYEKYIKAPLGLERSKFNIAVDEPNAAVSYSRKEVGEFRADDSNVCIMRGIAGSGAEFWTLSDIERFTKAVFERSDKLYAPELYKLAERNYTLGSPYREGRGLIVDERYAQTGRLFPTGSFGHCGHTGCSMFMNRELELKVIILSNATRQLNVKSGFCGYDYGEIEKMRAELHNAIADDLGLCSAIA